MATSGPNFTTAGTNDAAIGTLAWSNPGNIVSDNGTGATCSKSGTGLAISNYLKGLTYGFAIPTSATINGITLEIDRLKNNFGTITDNTVSLVKAGSVVGSNKATGTAWPTGAGGIATYGSASDLWGTTWTPSDINNANFGAVLATNETGTAKFPATGNVDFFRITIDYTDNGVAFTESSKILMTGVGM